MKSKPDFNLDSLKRWKLREYTDSDLHPTRQFSVYDAIVFDFAKDKRLYVLSRGEWFEINQDYVALVEKEIAAIEEHGGLVLPAAFQGETEGAYNARAASVSGGALALLDDDPVMYGGGYSRIEVCDLLSLTKDFIHIKSRTKSSALSHLFAQGVVSAQAFRDVGFRALAKIKCPGSHSSLFDGEPVYSDFTITYGVITTAIAPLREALPFFSKQSLANAARSLRAMSYQVKIKKIDVQAT